MNSRLSDNAGHMLPYCVQPCQLRARIKGISFYATDLILYAESSEIC